MNHRINRPKNAVQLGGGGGFLKILVSDFFCIHVVLPQTKLTRFSQPNKSLFILSYLQRMCWLFNLHFPDSIGITHRTGFNVYSNYAPLHDPLCTQKQSLINEGLLTINHWFCLKKPGSSKHLKPFKPGQDSHQPLLQIGAAQESSTGGSCEAVKLLVAGVGG